MNNKKIIKEFLDPEQNQQLMSLAVSVEESALKLYKYVSTDVQDQEVVEAVSALKFKVSTFVNNLQSRNKKQEGDSEMIDLNQSKDKKDFIESVEIGNDDENSDDPKNDKLSLDENKVWKHTINIKKEFKLFSEAYSIGGFKSKRTKSTLKQLVESIKSKSKKLTENLDSNDALMFEEAVEDFNTVEDADQFDECYGRMTEWADKNNKLYIIVK